MHYKQITPYMAVFAAALLLAACNSYVQTTSGAEYLNRYKQARTSIPLAQRRRWRRMTKRCTKSPTWSQSFSFPRE